MTGNPVAMKRFDIISGDTYTSALHELAKQAEANPSLGHPIVSILGRNVYRPYTFHENIHARVEAYESGTKETRLRLFGDWLDSCTGIAYKAGSTRFKIIPMSSELITIDKGFTGSFLPCEYDKLDGIELDSERGKFNELLTKGELLEHKAWLACLDEDKALLKAYSDIVFAEYVRRFGTSGKLMGFYVRSNTAKDELRAACVNSLNGDSYAGGYDDLYDGSRFLLGSPVVVSAEGAQKNLEAPEVGQTPKAGELYSREQITIALEQAEISGIEKILLEHLKKQ